MIAMRFRDVLPPYVADEFDSLIGQLKAWALEEHDEEGHHIVEDFDIARVPVGASMEWWTDTAPNGWVFAHGQQLNRVKYKALFDLWGTTFGAGDGSTTFNIPDKRGRYAFTKATSGTGDAIGETFGAIDHTHSGGSITGGTITGSTAAENSHTHGSGTYATETHDHGGDTAGPSSEFVLIDVPQTGTVDVTLPFAGHDHDISTQAALDVTGNSGSGSSHLHGAGTLAVTGLSLGTSGTANPPSITNETIVFTGVAA